ncbi:MAG: SMI1/KNR4 family protein [Hassallia sp.]
MDKLWQIRNKLTQLAILDTTFQIFGSESHQYQFNPCLEEAQIEAFEVKYNIRLPSEYRNFLLEVGNGGTGPGYGLYRLPGLENENEITAIPSKKNEGLLCKPFLLKEAWNDLNLMIKDKADTENNPYFDSKFVQGTITIAHYGCGIYAMLVVSGEQKGKIWIDDRTNDGGIYPATLNFCHYFHADDPDDFQSCEEEQEPLSFYDWYEDWLNQSLLQSL